MKKFLIIIIVLLSILAIGQSIYYKLNKSENESPSINQSEEQDEKLLYILGMSDIYNKYQPKIQFEELEKRFYSFINVNLPEVYKNTYEKNVEEIKQYYEANIEKIKSMYIYNEEEFISIVKQLQNIYNSENEIVNIIDYRIDTNSIMPLQNGLISFETIFSYDNETTLRVKFVLSENDENMLITSASNLDKVFQSYSGNAKKSELLKKIETLISNIRDIRQNSTLKTENEKLQYYDLNEESLNNIGIYSAEDYISISTQINTMNWRYQDISYINFEVDNESITNEAGYFSFKMKLYYSYDSKIDLIVKMYNDEPNIRFSGDIIA